MLHVDLADNDECVVTIRRVEQGMSPEQRELARQRLRNLSERIAERTKDLPEQEIEAAIDEAIRFARAGSTDADHIHWLR
jgi:hypothetical protein